MTRLPLIALGSLTVLTLAACQPEEGPPAEVDAPRIADLDTTSRTTLVDRSAALDGAVDFDEAEEGALIDFSDPHSGYLMDFDGSAITAHSDEAVERTFRNFTAAVVGVTAADLVTASVLAPPAVAIGITSQGDIQQLAPNVWQATNSLQLADGSTVSGELTVTWVAAGWISEMRYSTDDVTDALWFNGFLSYQGALGWWDLYDVDGTHAGVVEWATNGIDGEFGMMALSGEHAGDYLIYTALADHYRIDHHDESTLEDSWIDLTPSLAGSVRLPTYNAGAEACWDITFNDVDCL